MSLLCRLKKLVHKGELSAKDLDRIVIISKDATNGDIIKAMFPNIQWDNECDVVFYGYKTNDRMMEMLGVDFNWWNSPYRKEQE